MRLATRYRLPLLAKELVEQAARRRTYTVRVAYACMLFAASALFYLEIASRGMSNPFAVLGQGRQIFEAVVYLQFMGIYAFMPAITCGIITLEKERNSLGLLLLTRLGPGAIVLEKFLGRVVTMLTFLLLSVPVLVVAYTMGGVTPSALGVAIWLLMVTVLQVGALATLCSTYFRTTVGAFIGTYVLGFALYFTPLIIQETGVLPIREWLVWLARSLGFTVGTYEGSAESLLFMPPFFDIGIWGGAAMAVWASVPGVLSIVAFLCLSRVFLWRRAFVPPGNPLLRLFHGLDAGFQRLNQNRVTRGKVLIQETPSLPVFEPVTWLETSKKSLGRFRYLLRLFIVLEFFVLLACAAAGARGVAEPLGLVMIVLWVFAALVIAVKASSLIAGERTHETLDVLLSTPLFCQDIVEQKFQALRRLILVMSVVLLTVVLYKTWMMHTVSYTAPLAIMTYLVCSLLSIAIYLRSVAWLSMLIGIRVRSQARAIFTTVTVILAWCVMPMFAVVMFFQIARISPNTPWTLMAFVSPAMIIPFNEFMSFRELGVSPRTAIVVNFAFHGALMRLFRYLCHSRTKHYLGRCEKGQERLPAAEVYTAKKSIVTPIARPHES